MLSRFLLFWTFLISMEFLMVYETFCPMCKTAVTVFRNPFPTADVIIYAPGRGIVLVERAKPPHGWALPGGFIDYGESAENAAVREAKEETGLDVQITGLLGVYSKPDRDPRHHTLGVVYTAVAMNPEALAAGDDAAKAVFCPLNALPQDIAFDHRQIIADFISRARLFMLDDPGVA
jgi:8-oxo-dGTP diphosphatase